VFSVNVVSRKKLIAFWLKHPDATEVLAVWYRTLQKSNPKNFSDLKNLFNTVDLAAGYTIFDVGGNKFRVIVILDYAHLFAKIRFVFTHEEYNHWNAAAERALEEQQKREKIKSKKGKHDA
jgi:mRNA interferase HigB